MIDFLDQLATCLGYFVLLAIAMVVGGYIIGAIIDTVLWFRASKEAKQVGAEVAGDGDFGSGLTAAMADMFVEAIDEEFPDPHVGYEPSPVAQLDWSIDNPPSTEVNVIKSALVDAGYYIHPFPSEREGEWSNRHVGIWKSEPTWYVEDGEGNRVEVTPDTHQWEIEEAEKVHV